MQTDNLYMNRCLELAQLAFGDVAPNPMVGAVVVYNDRIIGEGYHHKFGDAHAEVNAINTVKEKEFLQHSTLYLNLEPCSHFGKTPPCVDLIIKSKIPKVIIANVDPNPVVKGKGIRKLMNKGVQVKLGILEHESKELNKRYFVYHEEKRPYIILKWAETKDRFIAKNEKDFQKSDNWITNEVSRKVVHQWRSEEQSIMVGTKTAQMDNPQLNVRLWKGNNPVRFVIDRNLILSPQLNLMDGKIPTVVFTEKNKSSKKNLEFVKIDFGKKFLKQISGFCYNGEIQSVIVEGGKKILTTFIEEEFWDEARVFTGNKFFKKGILSPLISGELISEMNIIDDRLSVFRNRQCFNKILK